MTDAASDTAAEQAPAAPLLKVINADATPEEVAAIVAVFASLGGGAPAPKPKRAEWNNPARGVRRTLPATWRTSTLP
ncbi:acyl-CoA carboxylase subunit epsilon [Nocardioides sp.]|uniref:acyl-CoA carboxylase subunit epsilon n=1 Tax=Nocardioides sp. TaxID=35761 RepID=UPI0026276859|nr:acyl-CoA carboxylase subunit epsilon [Nocardioides sp.]